MAFSLLVATHGALLRHRWVMSADDLSDVRIKIISKSIQLKRLAEEVDYGRAMGDDSGLYHTKREVEKNKTRS